MNNNTAEDRERRALDEAQKEYLLRDQEYRQIREMLAGREKELEIYKNKIRSEQREREEMLMQEFTARERLFAEREKALIERQKEQEQLFLRRQEQFEELRQALSTEIEKKETDLTKALQELQQEKGKYTEESRRRIETKSTDYVTSALELLEEKENRFQNISRNWSIAGAVSLVFGICILTYLTLDSFITMPASITWPYIAFCALKGIVIAGLLGALARYAYLFSASHMREALKNADRRHAINFGKFYLESYGAAADWNQIQEAFKHWNTTGSNAFTENADTDFTSMGKVVASLEQISKALSKNER